jgi:hypothetical protein
LSNASWNSSGRPRLNLERLILERLILERLNPGHDQSART